MKNPGSNEAAPILPAVSFETPTRWISLLWYAPAMVLLLIVVADSGQYPDPDLWGHLRFGQAALASGQVVTTDSYSYSTAHHVWLNHEWLTEVVMALAYNGLGVVGLKLWKFACVAVTILSMTLAMAETGASPPIQLNLLGIAALAMVPQNQFRPQLFTFMLFAVMLALLARYTFRGRAPLWLVIPIMALWGNLHGGFIIGIATMIAYTGLLGLHDLNTRRGLHRMLRLGAITIAGTLATLISPYGIDNWRVVFNALKVHAAHPIIADWQPLLRAMIAQWRLNPPTVIFFLAGIAIMLAFAATFVVGLRERSNRNELALSPLIDLPLVAIAAMMIVAAFAAVRNMPLAVIACMAPLARRLEALAARRRKLNLTRSLEQESKASIPHGDPYVASLHQDRSGMNPWVVILVAVAMAAFAGLFSPRLIVDAREYPTGAVAYIKEHGMHGNILSDFAWGQYLIWHLETASKVFMDGRYDSVYPEAVVDQYLSFINGGPDALNVLRAYPHDLVLLPLKAPAVTIMNSTPGWKIAYRDGSAALFVRADSMGACLIDIPRDVPPSFKGGNAIIEAKALNLPGESAPPTVSYFP